MLPFNTFSIHDLAGFMTMAFIFVAFCLIYWKLERRGVDLVFAALAACSSAACLAAFLGDNLVLAGADALAVPAAAAHNLALTRASYIAAMIGLPLEVHFVLRYCGRRSFLSRHLYLAYAGLVVALPAAWSPLFLAPRAVPLAATSSWACAMPWLPQTGPLVLGFCALWGLAQVYLFGVLWPPGRRAASQDGGSGGGALGRAGLIRTAILVEGTGALAATAGGFLNYAGASIFPVSCVVASLLVAAALFRERVGTEQAKQRMDHELALAARIQEDLLPADNPSVAGFDVAGWSRPSAQTGGDTYDFARLPEGRWMIALADASGHGIGPALVMCETRATLRALAAASADPVEILHRACELLDRRLPEGHFVTCFLGVLDPTAAAVAYASAGQGPLIFYNRQADRFDLDNASQPPLPLAFRDGQAGTSHLRRRQFAVGDLLVLASDGFWESTGRDGEMFGMPRLLEVLRRARDLGAARIIDQARQDIERFTAPNKPTDDLTMVVIRKV